MQQKVEQIVQGACQKLFGVDAQPNLTRPEEQFGDYATNVAMQLAGKLPNPPAGGPYQIAEELATEIEQAGEVDSAKAAKPGFINITLTDKALTEAAFAATNLPKSLAGQEILVEFGDPNPFKEMHIGHLYSYVVGDAISSLLEANGAKVQRLSYHGDVGLHVAKAVWDMRRSGVYEDKPGAGDKVMHSMLTQLGHHYAMGAKAYEDDPKAKAEIDVINEHIYKKDNADINNLYEQGKKLSFDVFDWMLKKLGIKTDRRYVESQTADVGINFVKDNIGRVFELSDGAVIYRGEKAGLHTRVFITGKGLPTYEAKDLGLAKLKNQDYPEAFRSIIITANEQAEYFKVMLAALGEIDAELAGKTTHLSHGFLSLTTGKMSSRAGNIYSASDLLDSVQAAVSKLYPDNTQDLIYLGAVKYTLLKHRLGQNIVVNPHEAASLEGNSGPYLQYAHARAKSILNKASKKPAQTLDLQVGERSLARKISEYPEIVAKATSDLMPSHICTYLYELAQNFNRFYENNRVIGDEREAQRLTLIEAYADVLKHGLATLNIEAPQKV